MKTDGFLNARQAAAYVGYEVGDGPSRTDPQMRCFYAFMEHHKVKKHKRGASLLFKREDLDRAIGRATDQHNAEHQDRLERMAELARTHARGQAALH
jgi:hypothetical protein